jgi:hypothetical protein
VAFSERFLLVSRLEPGLSGWTAVASSRKDLPDGLLYPSAVQPNFRSVSELASIAAQALEEVGARRGACAAIVPDLATRAFVLRNHGASGFLNSIEKSMARFPFPRSEARFDTWKDGAGSLVLAGGHGAVLGQYESALEALGYRATILGPASLVRLSEWARAARRPGGEAATVHIQLYPRHYAIARFLGGELAGLHFRLRALGDPEPVLVELGRLAAESEATSFARLTLTGEGARAVEERLSGEWAVRAQLGEEGEEAHLGSLLLLAATRI